MHFNVYLLARLMERLILKLAFDFDCFVMGLNNCGVGWALTCEPHSHPFVHLTFDIRVNKMYD